MTKKMIFLAIGVLLLFAVTRAEESWEKSLLANTHSEAGVDWETSEQDRVPQKSAFSWIRIADDRAFGPDKIEHYMNFLVVTFFCHKGFGMKTSEAFVTSSGLAFGWEVKDGVVDWRDERFIITIFGGKFHLGGDGFSLWDLGWSVLGAGTYYLLTKKG